MICPKSISVYKLFRHYWWLFLLGITTLSCNQKNRGTNRYSNAFTPVFDSVNKLLDAKKSLKALHFLDSSFNKIPNPGYNDRFRYYGYYFNFSKDPDHQKALLYADSMMMMATKTIGQPHYVVNFSEANFALGDAYFNLKRYGDAFQYYYQGYLTGKNYLNNEALSDYTYRMGMIMYQKGHYKVAADYFKESYKQKSVTITPGDFAAFYRRQELLDNIGLSYRHANDNDSSLLYFNKALQFINDNTINFPTKANDLEKARGVIYGNKAEVYIDKKEYNTATNLLEKSIAINLKKGFDNNDAIFAELKLANIYNNQRKTRVFNTLLTQLRNQLDTIKNSSAEAQWNRLMADCYTQNYDLKNALIYINRYIVLKDSLIKQASLLKESDVNEHLANYEKEHQIELLSNDNKKQLISIYAILAFTIMSLLIIFLIYRDWKRSKKDVLQVNLLNQQINKQNAILENALNELKLSSQEKDRILRAVAHDLRNPIGGIASLTAVMAEDDYTDEQKEMINLVKETSFNSLELINEILEATNIASIELVLEQVEINSLVSNSVELLRFKASEKNQTILFEPLQESQELYISREKIWRVISNLISNALKFSPENTLIFVKVEKKNNEVIISVKDNGIGIPEKLKDQVFNMFTSAQRPGTAGEKSFGLGLSICKQIIEKSNGKIWFTSDKENGTIFYISLSLAETNIAVQSTQQPGIPKA